ncbi:hypothetical protein LQZ21_14725, partial [Treponema sp. TIM-1]|uniref:reverse transcriptase domain-containing protein n=1 Tax=Treponema sp. TIM-1 TaxID=2898417 RepID=UPI003981760D
LLIKLGYYPLFFHRLIVACFQTFPLYLVKSLIKKFLKNGIMVDGLVSQNEQGTPQSGNLSPLLSNIYLTKFDRMLEERGQKFVRYADDCNIYVRSIRAAGRVMESCTKFLEGKLRLKVNRKKSTTGSPTKLKFLGFSLYRRKDGVGIRVHEKPLKRLTDRLRGLTSRKRGGKMERILEEISRLLIGWLGYYSIVDLKGHLVRIGGWIRRRIRQMYWKRWKRARTRCENLIQLGISPEQAWQWANTRKGYWRIVDSPILKHTLTNQYLETSGFPDVLKRFEMLHERIGRHLRLRMPVPAH